MPRTLGGAFAALLVAVGGMTGAGAQPQPDTPAVTVTPDHTTDGGTVTVTTSGFPAGLHAFLQCRSSYADIYLGEVVWAHCRLMSELMSGGVPAASFIGTVEREFTVSWTGPPEIIDCDTEPGGCIVGVLVANGSSYAAAWAPISFTPRLVAQPSRGLADGDTVDVSTTEVPPGDWSVAQCIATFDSGQPPPAVDSACGPPTPVALDGDTVTGTVTVHDPLVAVDGTVHECAYTGCVLVLRAPEQPVRAVGGVSFGPPSITFSHPQPLGQMSSVQVVLAGLPGSSAIVRQSASPPSQTTCDAAAATTLDDVGGAVINNRTVPSTFTALSGTAVDCSVTPCSLVAESDGVVVAVSAPLPLPPPTRITLSPSSGLLEGQPIGVEVVGLTPGVSYSFARCADPSGGFCESAGSDVATAAGTITTTIPASQRLLDVVYCRAQCFISVLSDVGFRSAPYAMAEGSVTVTPDQDLSSGDTVQVTGTDLLPTYTGRLIGPWPTGVAAVTQCAAVAAEAPSLFAALHNCGTTTTTPLSITSPEVETTLTVQETFTTFTGRAVDCGSPGACVVGIYRFDQDGSATALTRPVTFGP